MMKKTNVAAAAAVAAVLSGAPAFAMDGNAVKAPDGTYTIAYTDDSGLQCKLMGATSTGVNAAVGATTACQGADGAWRLFIRDSEE
jgi:hypothetical protein